MVSGLGATGAWGRTRGRVPSRVLALPALLVGVALAPAPAEAQRALEWRDLVVTAGMGGEGYQGNLPSAGAAIQDSTETATALVGEVGIRGDGFWRRNGTPRATLFFDGGMRQFAARGFEQRDYAPREWVGLVETTYLQPVGDVALLSAFGGFRGRAVRDRTPMPLFLQPGHGTWFGGGTVRTAFGGWSRLELSFSAERAAYTAPEFAPQISLLDRESRTVQLSVARPITARHSVETFVALDRADYREQLTFHPDDPFRKDQTVRARLGWSYRGGIVGRAGVEGRVNRSNSRRPEYESVTVDGQLSAALSASTVATAYVVLTAKRYREATPFARLLPGEEANSASVAYLSLTREVARNLDSSVRLGWTRAETETGGDYFQRIGVNLLMTYRPGF